MQLDLIPGAAPKRRTMAEARKAGEAGRERVSDAVEREAPGWMAAALEAVRRFAEHQHGEWTVEAMRTVLEAELPPTSRKRVWGPLTQSAIRAGLICKTGRFAPTASSNGSPRPTYRRKAAR